MKNNSVIVVIGAGSIGLAIVRRVGAGKHILLTDLCPENSDAAAKVLSEAGFEVSTTTSTYHPDNRFILSLEPPKLLRCHWAYSCCRGFSYTGIAFHNT